jgi:hypothetical protein
MASVIEPPDFGEAIFNGFYSRSAGGTLVVAYPKDVPMNYDELETLVTAALPTDRPFVLLGESFSGPAAVAASVAADPSAGMRGRRAVFYAPGLGRQDFEQPGRPWPARYSD